MIKLPEHVSRSIICGPIPVIRKWRKLAPAKLTRAERNMRFIERYCVAPEGKLQGKPVVLDIFQEAFFYAVYDNPHGTSEAYLSIGRKNAKALPLDTPIPTPNGFVNMADIEVGQHVFDSNGNPTRVIEKSDIHRNKDIYEITFDDGAKIKSCSDHQWSARIGGMDRPLKTRTTKELYRKSIETKKSIAMPIPKSVCYSEKNLDLDPYLFGVWLGDGSSSGATVYTGEQDLGHFVENLSISLGYKPVVRQDSRPGSCYTIALFDGVWNCRDPKKIRTILRKMGVLNNKHIPQDYLLASKSQRLALLQGLMDTDGHVNVGNKNPRCVFTQKNRRLCSEVLELARSLGLKASLKERLTKVNGDKYFYYQVSFNAYRDQQVFRLVRKQSLLNVRGEKEHRSSYRYIKHIEKTETVDCQCISVEAKDSLYLCGREYTVTHNTATIAMLVLVHLVGPESFRNSEIMSGARSRHQAGQVYRYASKMVMASEELSKYVRVIPSGKKLIGLPLNVEYAASSAEAKTAHGGSPVVAILDELGQVRGPQDDYVDAIITSQGAYDDALRIGISTQAPNDADLFSIILDDAKSSNDPHIVAHIYSADDDCDIMDEKQWKYANPALGNFRSEVEFRKAAEKAKRMPSYENTFRNLYLNQRVEVTSPFVSKTVWMLCGAEPAEINPDLPVWGGLDLSQRTDLTALVLAQKQSGVWQTWVYFWTPEIGVRDRAKKDRAPYELWVKSGKMNTTPGATVDYSYVAAEVVEITKELNVKGIAFDRWRIDDFKKELAKLEEDLPEEDRLILVPHGQGFKDMSPSIEALEAELLNARIAHGMHPVLTMCASNALVVYDPTKARKFEKQKSTGRIDGLVAMAMAIGIASRTEEPEDETSVYESRGLLVI